MSTLCTFIQANSLNEIRCIFVNGELKRRTCFVMVESSEKVSILDKCVFLSKYMLSNQSLFP